MTVYVDEAIYPYKGMTMCHMISDTIDELNQMADMINVNRKEFQRNSKYPHYDICKSKRKLALKYGAKEINIHDLVELLKKIRIPH